MPVHRVPTFDPPACLVDLGAALADAAYEFTVPAERLAVLIETAAADGMDPAPLERIARYVRIAQHVLNLARQTGFQAADAAADAEAAAYRRYVEGVTP